MRAKCRRVPRADGVPDAVVVKIIYVLTENRNRAPSPPNNDENNAGSGVDTKIPLATVPRVEK